MKLARGNDMLRMMEDAKRIEAVRSRIRNLSIYGQAYEVFICYKQTDPNSGKATRDAGIAEELFYALGKLNVVTFYAPYSLKDKAGADYEALIYHALDTCKIMLVLGSDSRYFQGVWVRSEWERYLERMSKGGDRTLIPVQLFDMRSSELPSQMSGRQAWIYKEHYDPAHALAVQVEDMLHGEERKQAEWKRQQAEIEEQKKIIEEQKKANAAKAAHLNEVEAEQRATAAKQNQ